MKKPQSNSIREAWILCLILGLIMINFPFIHIFNTPVTILGIPILIFYFLVGWPLSIAVIWFFVRYFENDPKNNSESGGDKSIP
ncbi:hypothetical protein SAMN05660420_01198 [Desulfuromusa kysingii]|uniref:DUF3311 domain-containing protein n=1 Tax=Desulfuromusa kysingii TaxID=37625 RepID=A0A1H3YDP4_9BACT|nr:hypothetical protein [Desulfuromusa kysingii]SEA09725.1 hypothetical protein SAMN05660420_01198 [Desulfuromusa kysingii]